MKILPLLALVACVMVGAGAQEEEPRPVAARGLLKRGPLAKGKTTTTTTPAPQEEEAEYDEGDYPAEGDAQEPSTEAPTSTTEGKKLVAGGVRPFRSNKDLLDILQKKRQQAAKDKLNGPTSTTTSAPAQDSVDSAKATFNNKSKKRFNNAPVTREVSADEAPAPKPSRGRFGRPASRSAPEVEEEPSESAPAPRTATRAFRRGSN